VFMQFDRSSDGVLTPLPKPSIDTGMGLERISCVLQGKLSNYESDLFTPLIAKAAELTGFVVDRTDVNAAISPLPLVGRDDSSGGMVGRDDSPKEVSRIEELALSDEKGAASLRIIADHARAATFLISDGVQPANEGRGYVLRKILRRGIRHGRLLGQEKPFMHEMVLAVRDEMAVAYPELKETAGRVAKVVLAEELQFARVMEIGSRQLDLLIANKRAQYLESIEIPTTGLGSDGMVPSSWSDLSTLTISGAEGFRLYETFGLPLDFMVDAARDAGLGFDQNGFDIAKEEEQQRARASWKGGSQKSAAPVYRELAKTEFEGYSALRVDGARVLALVKDGVGVQVLQAGEVGEVVLDATSFYAD